VTEAAAKGSGLAALTGWQWRVLLTAPAALLATWLSLRLRGYRATLDRARPAHASGLDGAAELQIARETAYAMSAAIKYGPWRPRCLLRSLTLVRYLGRRGISPTLRIGLPAGQAALNPGSAPGFAAHAWVEHEGVVLNDRADVAAAYSAFDAPPGRT